MPEQLPDIGLVKNDAPVKVGTLGTSATESAAEKAAPASDRGGVREYTFGPFRVNVPYCQLWRDKQLVLLTPKAFDTLVFLIGHRDHIVSKEELMAAVWPNAFVSEDTLTQNISAIRRALCDDADKPGFVATIPRRGYRFIAPVVEKHIAPDVEGVVDPTFADEASAADQSRDTSVVGAIAGAGVNAVPGRWARAIDGRRQWYALAIVAVVLAGAWGIAGGRRASPVSAAPGGPVRFEQQSPRGATLVSGGILSPDGRQLAFVAQDDRTGETHVWIRTLDAAEPRSLPGTEGALRPFWSPDGRYIGFFAGSSLKRVGLSDETPRTVTPVATVRPPGASWNNQGLILFASSNRSGLSIVPASGGDPRPVTTLNAAARDVGHRWPYFLPDGRHFLYSVASADANRAGVYIGMLDSNEPHARLLDASAASAIYAPPGYLLYVRHGSLIAHAFDVSSNRLSGDPILIAENVRPRGAVTDTVLSASADGLLTFGGDASPQRLAWFDREGRQSEGFNVALINLSFSRDGRALIGNAASTDLEGGGVWWLDMKQGVPTEVAANGNAGLWSPDGSRIAYVTQSATGQAVLHIRSSANAADDTPLGQNNWGIMLDSWSPDGRYLVHGSYGSTPANKRNLWLVPTTGDHTGRPYSPADFNQIQGQISPDGRMITYASDESGIWEVYVDSFPAPGAKRRISINGGTQPQWSPSGTELFYLAGDRTLLRVEFAGGQFGRPQPLFRAPVLGPLAINHNYYAVAPDGQRFLFSISMYKPIVVLVNWASEIR